ncbi:hypothetical protein CRUP_033903, partial [Coryphaenoides rupestris]
MASSESSQPSSAEQHPNASVDDQRSPPHQQASPATSPTERALSPDPGPKERGSPGGSSPKERERGSTGGSSPKERGSTADSSSDSSSDEEELGIKRRVKSSVAQIKRAEPDNITPSDCSRSRDRDRSRSGERGRSRSRGQSRSRSRERDRSRDRGRHIRNTEMDHRRRGRSSSPANQAPAAAEEPPVKKKKEELDPILSRTGGAYIPRAKLRMMQAQITDKNSLAYQRMSWEALKKSINGLINKVNVSNIAYIIQELLQENIVRGRGLLSRSVLQAQAASPIFTHVYSAVVAIINSKFPQIGELMLKRLVLSLEMLTLLLERPNDDSVEVSIAFLKECAIFERLRNILHESAIDKRVQYMIEVMFAIRKDGFKDHPVIPDGLDLVDEEDQFTHMMPLEDDYNTEDILNVFKMDPDFQENEEKYKTIKKELCNMILDCCAQQRTYEKFFGLLAGKELCNMILDCCAQQRTYEKFFGLLAGRFCVLKKDYMESFEGIFCEQYETIHRLETNKLRNVARLFAHLLYTDSVPWSVLECIKVSEETTTSSSRIFVKILFQELCAYMGLPRLNQRLKDMSLQVFFEGLFPRDNPRNTRFAINFFTSIGLGGLTDELRDHLKNAPKMIMTQRQEVDSSDSSDDSSSQSDSGSSSQSESSSDSSSSSSTSSDSDSKHNKKKKQQKKKKKKKKDETSSSHRKKASNKEPKQKEVTKKKVSADGGGGGSSSSEEEDFGGWGLTRNRVSPPPHMKQRARELEERERARDERAAGVRGRPGAGEREGERWRPRENDGERREMQRSVEGEREKGRERSVERERGRNERETGRKERERSVGGE